jgi:molybdopterin-guanine dinucleotide biosynthesis protein B
VGTVKDIHAEGFSLEQAGSNTHRHREAGSLLVTARGLTETDMLYPRRLDIEEILLHYDQDFVILEGVRDGDLPQIIAAKDEQEVDERLDPRVIAITGVLANTRQEYKGLPVFSALTRANELVDFIEEQVDDATFGKHCTRE